MRREAQSGIGEGRVRVKLWGRRPRHDFRFRARSSPIAEGVVIECARCGWEHPLASAELAEQLKGMGPQEMGEVAKWEARKLGVWDDPCPPHAP